MPDVPLVESPVLPPSEHAITAPVQVPLVAQASSSDASAPRLISTVEYLRQPVPRYPPQSRKLREQGLVVLRVLIDERAPHAVLKWKHRVGMSGWIMLLAKRCHVPHSAPMWKMACRGALLCLFP